MSVGTYSELQTAIADWLARSDLTVSQISSLIAMFEAGANRRLRTREMEATSTLTTSSGTATLPTDYLSWRSLTWDSSPTVGLQFLHPEILRGWYGSADAGVPSYFTIEGSTLTTKPTGDDTTFSLRYYQKIPALTDSAPTNWLLTAHPDAYLSGSLFEANAFLQDAEGAYLWKLRMDEAFGEIEKLSERTKGPSIMRPMGPVV
jgi:hypothetical protein